MASEQSVVSAAATAFNPNISEPLSSTTGVATKSDLEPVRGNSLKRSRQEQLVPPNLSTIATAGLVETPSPKTPRYKGAFSPAFTPAPLTGAAALQDERRKMEESLINTSNATSENPSHKVMASLMAGGGVSMSKPQDVPVATTALSEGMSSAANAISISSPMQYDDKHNTSPASVTSLASLGSSAQTATAISTMVASPAAMTSGLDAEAPTLRSRNDGHLQPHSEEQSSNRAFSFPGNLVGQTDHSRVPPRELSLPMPGQNHQLAPRSPSQKKHKCPYCETEFTRHHNLKSHLLTHSQEKPYVCQTCSMRFRRLHDLKRHMKLHTGERPHVCPKCDRKFARGDALARHSKGQGGCAGRRSSMGGFEGDEDFDGSNAGDGDDSGMDGVMYTNGTPHSNENEMTEEERRRFSLPSIKAQHVSGSSNGESFSASRAPSTYPPAGPRPVQSSGGLYPPPADRGVASSSGNSSMQSSVAGGHTPNTSMSSMPPGSGGSIYSQGGMTESPKPLSPSAQQSHQLGHDSISRQRSPSLTTQFQQQHFGRRPSGRTSPPVISLPSPHGGPKLPPLAPPDQRYTLQSQTQTQLVPANGSLTAQSGQPLSGSTSPGGMYPLPAGSLQNRGSASNTSHQSSGSGDRSNNLFATGDQGLLSYVQTMEAKVKELLEKVDVMQNKERSQEEKINRLTEEVVSLRDQLNSQKQQQHTGASDHS